jgi:UDP:flavonoid glycosyltransferase YjiC (YdhE family)
MSRRRIVLATIGSLGDLHPMLVLATELAHRGHDVAIASTPFYRERIHALGFAFHPLRPDWDPTDSALIAQCEEIKRGPEILFRRMILPHLRDTYADLDGAVAGADLMLAGELVYAAPLVAEKRQLPWASVILSPTSFFSAHDPSLLVNAPALYRLRRAGWRINRAFLKLGKAASHHWWTSVRKLRAELGLRTQCDPVFRDKFASELVLALFSKVLAQPQPDWPRQTIQPGFLFYDKSSAEEPADRLQQFFSAGSPPLVFTQGSTAVHHPGSFYENSVRAARMLGRRALLIGTQQHADGDNVLAVPYASYAAVFPEAAAIVHQGGSGTTGQALRAGRPQLIVPFGWDQPDNAARVERLGAGLSLARVAYTPATAADALKRLLSEDRFRIAAEAARNEVRDTPALAIASDAIEALLSRCPKGD